MNQKEIIQKMRTEAQNASKKAYAPYSGAMIGSAVLTQEGKIYSGCNVENSSYGGTICAERTAILKAVSEGTRRISKVYVYSKAGWPPCGMCRQVMTEFALPDMEVIVGDEAGNENIYPFKDIMPLAFTPDKLDSI